MIQFAKQFYEDVELETFFESCGVADLITTCYGGRNRIAGEEFVKGKVRAFKIDKETRHVTTTDDKLLDSGGK